MEENIRLELNDWLFNAGIVGLRNILAHSGDKFKLDAQGLEFNISSLEKFEEKYINYYIDTYESTLSWNKIVSYEDVINHHENTDFKLFNKADLEKLNDYVQKTLKYYLKSKSYEAAYNLIENDLNVEKLAKSIKKVKLKKKEKIQDKIQAVKDIYRTIRTIINYCKEVESKKYLAGKNVIYTIIKNGWNGVCFLNPQTKEKDMYIDYRNYFVEPVQEYINSEEKNLNYNCFVCDRQMNNMNNNLSFLNSIGFDVSRKSSHVWNFNNDVAVCPICKLIYSCVPAGFTYIHGKGIYVNDNQSVDRAITVNNKIKSEIIKDYKQNRVNTYKALVNTFKEQINDNYKYELSDIQVIRYENINDKDIYRFNILSKKVLQVISNSKDDLDSIVKAGFKEVKSYFYIYELVVDRIFNNQNLFTLIHRLIGYKLSIPMDCRFSSKQIIRILNINYKFLEVMGYMENTNKDIIKKANISGYYLREQYKSKMAKDKLSGISYRLLNALKTNNKDMFMDTLLNSYLYAQKTVPQVFIEALQDDEIFKTIGYAFVTGLIEGKENNKNRGNSDDK
ncbi:MAG: type I-B CRISPR-associated protein Cas8b1/Cst1 [Firmicutes bacterium]|nr:type I-B CRISPR-associated protein Cas8b1/Cst1 [Bacillota bacterium]